MTKPLFNETGLIGTGTPLAKHARGVVAGTEPPNVELLLTENKHLNARCDELLTELKRLEAALNVASERNRDLAAQVKQMRDDMLKPMVRTSDPSTSMEAEEQNAIWRKEQIQQFVTVFREAGIKGLTDEQAHDIIGLQSHTPRVADLKRAGFLVATGEKRVTKSGSKARVYKLSPLAWQFIERA